MYVIAKQYEVFSCTCVIFLAVMYGRGQSESHYWQIGTELKTKQLLLLTHFCIKKSWKLAHFVTSGCLGVKAQKVTTSLHTIKSCNKDYGRLCGV